MSNYSLPLFIALSGFVTRYNSSYLFSYISIQPAVKTAFIFKGKVLYNALAIYTNSIPVPVCGGSYVKVNGSQHG